MSEAGPAPRRPSDGAAGLVAAFAFPHILVNTAIDHLGPDVLQAGRLHLLACRLFRNMCGNDVAGTARTCIYVQSLGPDVARQESLLGVGRSFGSHFSGIHTAELALTIIKQTVGTSRLAFDVQLQPVSACVGPACLPCSGLAVHVRSSAASWECTCGFGLFAATPPLYDPLGV